jgi:ABC-type nitrate/sulfonate/bicarbonate transport system substrate-binding protein
MVSSIRGGSNPVRIGFVPLIDAAPLIVAVELGLFERHGVRVVLERQIGWANVRDKLIYGHLDGAHALLGMPLTSVARGERQNEALVGVMSLGAGGNAITLSKPMYDRGVRSAGTLSRWITEQRQMRVSRPIDAEDRKPVIAHVFGCSTHHYLLREWLAAAGIDPDLDVRLCVIPPPQMARHMDSGLLDGFCVGEPWNTLAERNHHGVVVTPTTDIVPDHPEKVLAMSRRWAREHGEEVVSMIAALIEACAWCEETGNHPRLAEILAAEKYIAAPTEVLAASLRIDRSVGVAAKQHSPRSSNWRMRTFAPATATFPSATHAAWLAEQMLRWGHLPADTDVLELAAEVTDARHYREAAKAVGVPCPTDDFPPMQLARGAIYSPRKSPCAGKDKVNLDEEAAIVKQ